MTPRKEHLARCYKRTGLLTLFHCVTTQPSCRLCLRVLGSPDFARLKEHGVIKRHLHCRCGEMWISKPRDGMQTHNIRDIDRWKERWCSSATWRAQQSVQRQGHFKDSLRCCVPTMQMRSGSLWAFSLRFGEKTSWRHEGGRLGQRLWPRLTGQTVHAPRKKLVPWPEGPWVRSGLETGVAVGTVTRRLSPLTHAQKKHCWCSRHLPGDSIDYVRGRARTREATRYHPPSVR